MSSLRNAVKRKTHKERAQPSHRAKFGLLEKHKDYVLRARDFNKKKKRIQALQEKAAFRNKDEFYFKMEKTGTKNGIFTKLAGESMDAETLKLLKTQDFNYIALKKKTEDTKIDKMMNNLHSIAALQTAPKMNKHTLFVDSDEELESFEPPQHLSDFIEEPQTTETDAPELSSAVKKVLANTHHHKIAFLSLEIQILIHFVLSRWTGKGKAVIVSLRSG
jgi:U3 small nucleolar RNA-associated protein 11